MGPLLLCQHLQQWALLQLRAVLQAALLHLPQGLQRQWLPHLPQHLHQALMGTPLPPPPLALLQRPLPLLPLLLHHMPQLECWQQL